MEGGLAILSLMSGVGGLPLMEEREGPGDRISFFVNRVNFFKVVENQLIKKSSPMYIGFRERMREWECRDAGRRRAGMRNAEMEWRNAGVLEGRRSGVLKCVE
jgi:hypothetical protein